MRRDDGIRLARQLKSALLQQKIPVQQVFLFGSTARGDTHEQSDVDIAVVSLPFRSTRLEENVEVSKSREDIDLSIETVCLRPGDLDNAYSTLVQEIKRHGIEV